VDKAATLATVQDQYLFQPMGPTAILDNIGGQAEYGKVTQVNGTLRSAAQGAVAFAVEPKVSIGLSGEEKVSPTLIARMASAVGTTQDGLILCEKQTPVVLDRAFFNQGQNAQYDPQFYQDGTVPTLIAKGPSAVQIHYIVRRLTPTECARLQGFADWHGHLAQKPDLTDEEYDFWMEVRNTHAAINGKTVKGYTREQMLTWYNKLWTDAAEYKMWGNGIALPPALYCMQGIVDAIDKENDDSWML
jgi:DNA (cytosine-5)-methyltransferase 1